MSQEWKVFWISLAVVLVAAATLCLTSSDSEATQSEENTDTVYWITFDSDEGTSIYGDTATFQVKGGTNRLELPVTTWTKEGFYLSGWKSTADDETYSPGEEYVADSDDTLTAVWVEPDGEHKAGMDTVLDKNEKYSAKYSISGFWAPNSEEQLHLQKPDGITVGIVQGSSNQYTFRGSLSESGVYLVSMVDSNWDHDRIWWILSVPSKFDTVYSVEFYTNEQLDTKIDGTNAIYGPGGTAFSLPDGSKVGYTLLGWHINDGYGSNPIYSQGSSYTFSADRKAWPEWAGDAHAAVFIIDGGNLDVEAFVTYTGQGFQLIEASHVKPVSGQTFIGWQQVKNKVASGPLYAPGLTISASETLIFRAFYVGDGDTTYKVTFDAGEGTGGFTQTVKAGMSVYLPTEYQMNRTGYNFTGWNEDGSDTIQNGGGSYLPTGNVTLHANWKLVTKLPRSISISSGLILRIGETRTWKATSYGDSDAVRGVRFRITSGDGIYAEISEQGETSSGGYCTLKGIAEGSITLEAYSVSSADVKDTKTIQVKGPMNQFQILYDTDEGSAVSPTVAQSDNSGVTLNVTSTVPTKTGYTFDCWNTSRDGSGTEYLSGSVISLPKNGLNTLTLYAQWTQDPYTFCLKYELGHDATGAKAPGSIKAESKSVEGDDESCTFTVSEQTPGWAGYKFLGWSYDQVIAGFGSESDVDVEAGQEITVSREKDSEITTEVLYAVWADNHVSYVLILDSNSSGESSQKSIITKETVAFYLAIQIPTDISPVNEGKEFVGWAESRNYTSGDVLYTPGSYITMDADSNLCTKTLYAAWIGAGNSYSITFQENAGNDTVQGMPSSVSALRGSTSANITVPDDIPVRQTSSEDFYIFAGWKNTTTEAFKLGTVYPGQTITTSYNLVFEAIWMPFTLKADGGSVALTNGGAAIGISVYVDWDDGSTGSLDGTATKITHSYNAKGTYNVGIQLSIRGGLDADVTRSVDIEIASESYTITYYSNDGNDLEETSVVTIGGSVIISEYMFDVPSGKTFVCWNKKADGSGLSYAPGTRFTPENDVPLYAQWKQIPSESYTITFHPNNGGSDSAVVRLGPDVGECMFSSPDGKEFASWNTEADGSGKEYLPGATIDLTSDIDLYAQWKAIPSGAFVITYHSNDKKDNFVLQSGTSVKARNCMFSASDGKEFASWNTEADGSGKEYLPGATIDLTSDIDLYAQWVASVPDGEDGGDGGTPAWAIAVVVIAILIVAGIAITRVV